MDLAPVFQNLATTIATGSLRLAGAIIVWIVGGWTIKLVVRTIVVKGMRFRHIDETVVGYVSNTVTIILKITLAIAILSMIGVETTSFAALIAAAGIAIGAAWSGLLANFAAGAFLIILRPFKAGDFIEAGDTTGTVREVGLFVTTIDTLDNVRTYVGNNKIFADNIKNFSVNPYRRVDITAQIDHSVDCKQAIELLKEALLKIPNVLSEPTPDVDVHEFTPMGPVLAVRPYCHTNHYWQVYFDTNMTIKETFGAAKYAAPQQHLAIANHN